jgi:outer membrane protein OmpA-like peptidoglycan-associated protein
MFLVENRSIAVVLSGLLALVLVAGCETFRQETQAYSTKRDKTAKGAGIGAAAGAGAAILTGKRELDEILAGAAIGAAVGGGVGFYMDRQEEKLARIPGTSVERVGKDSLLVRFDSDVLFKVDSAIVDPSGQTTLDRCVEVLTEFNKTAVLVQGHTDSTGSEAYNQQLSERRATAVQNYLIGRGVEPTRIAAIGYGEAHPVASNTTVDGRRWNRRVDILLKAKGR